MSAAAELLWTSEDPKAELRSLFENAPVGVAACQRQGTITALNPAAEQMLGGSLGMARPLSLSDLTDDSGSKRLVSELFDGERDHFQIEGKGGPDGSTARRWTAWRVPGSSDSPDYALVIADEATDHRQVEQRLRQAQKLEAVGRLAGGLAHDFNNVLTGVLLYCDLLIAGLEPGHRLQRYAEEIRTVSLQAIGLVRQLLSVSRPSNGEARVLSLNEVAEGMRNLLQRLVGDNIGLTLGLDPNLGFVRIDPTQAQQLLLNLVLNARDALPAGGEIVVETRNCKVQVLAEQQGESAPAAALPCALFVVRDNGTGMDEETRAHLFEAFFTTKPAGKGTGLGLATVHDIVTSHGGLIHVDSAPGRGTRVSVLLPLVPAAPSDFCCSSHSSQGRFEGVSPLQEESQP